MARLLVISTFEVYPKGGLLSGPAIRTLEIARALSRRGHEVVLAQSHRMPYAEDVKDRFRVVKWDEDNIESLCEDADALFAAHYLGAFLYERVKDIPVVVDLFDPEFMALLESGVLFPDRNEHFDRLGNVRANLDAALALGDLFVCAGDRQKDFYLGMLALAGRITPETLPEEILALVPTGAPAELPKRKGDLVLFRGGGLPNDWNIILCPGGLYPWFDSETPILALRKALNQYPKTALIFVGAKNPISPEFSEAGVNRAEKLASDLDLLHKHVFFHPWVAYEDRGVLYLESDLAVISSKASSETTYSFRTRIIDCLWGGLPIVCTSGDSLGKSIEEAGAGRTVPSLDPEALALAMVHYIGNESARKQASESALHLAHNTYSWDKSVAPIHEFLDRVTGTKPLSHHGTLPTDRVTVGIDLKRQQRLLEQKNHFEFRNAAAEKRLRKLRKKLDLASRTVRNITLEVENIRQRAEMAEATISYIYSGRGWKTLQTYFRLRDRFFPVLNAARTPIQYVRTWGFLTALRRLVKRPAVTAAPLLLEQYKAKTGKSNPTRIDAGRMRKEAASWEWKPLISIATPAYNTDPAFLSQAIESVRRQLYPNWELCLVDDGSTHAGVREVIQSAVDSDTRIRCRFLSENGGIVEASNACLGMCKGEFVGFLDHDDTLEPRALWEVVRLLQEKPDADIIYTDEDKVDAAGVPVDVFFRPDWSPEFLLSTMYMVHFNVFRHSLLEEINGFRNGFTISQDYDLLLRASEKADRIYHIPKVLYHWRVHDESRSNQERAMEDTNRFSRKALNDSLERRNLHGEVGVGAFFNFFRVKYRIVGKPKVSIIIPTRDQLTLLDKLLSTLREKSSWPNYEIIVVDNQSGPRTRAYLKHSNVKTLRAPYPFNFSLMMNQGAKAANGEFLLFLNNDMEVIESEWIEALLEYAQLRDVGAVGAKLIYPDVTIQHAGVVLGLSHNTVAGHIFQGLPSASPGYQGWINTVRNVSAVTAACMMTPRELFQEMGGFEPKLGVAFQDVDYCLRLMEKGYRSVYTPHSCLIHYESVSRGRVPDRGEEVRYMHERWGRLIANDPYYNPNLTLTRPDATLRK